jgi:DNA-directed RNA polymerase subunit RPC12/RpoP
MEQLKVLLDTDGEPNGLQCPRCEAKISELIEVDTATRWNRAEPEFEDGCLILRYHLGQSDFEHTTYLCDNCNVEVALPEDYNDEAQDTLAEIWD